MGHVINRVGWGGWFMKSTGGEVGHAGVGWVMQRWRGVSHTVKQPKKYVSPQNQDLTTPKPFLEGLQNLSFEYKNNYYNFYYYNYVKFPIISKTITRCSWYKKSQWHDYYISSKRKKQKGCLYSHGTEMLSPKAATNKNMPSPTLSRKQLTIISQKKRQNT